jgi:hypothetical protein
MKILAILLLLLLGVSVQAQPPSYGGVRELAEQQDPTNSIPPEERIYICSEWPVHQYSFIQRYQEGLTIRQLIDNTKYKSTRVEVKVFRPLTKNSNANEVFTEGCVFDEVVSPTNSPAYTIKARDAILLENMNLPRSY